MIGQGVQAVYAKCETEWSGIAVTQLLRVLTTADPAPQLSQVIVREL